MKPQIRKLAEQATKQVTKPDGHYIVQEWQRVFAELIVRECANVCKQIGDSHISDLDGSPEFGSGAYFSAKRITQHFGVEE